MNNDFYVRVATKTLRIPVILIAAATACFAAQVFAEIPNFGPLADDEMRAHFINIGQGASTLLEFPCSAVLIDTGGESTTKSGAKFSGNEHLKAYLDDFFVRRSDLNRTFDVVFLTHPHPDHTNGVAVLLDPSNHFTVSNVVDDALDKGKGWPKQRALRAVGEENDAYQGVRRGAISSTLGMTGDIIDPPLPPGCQSVDPLIRALWGKVSRKPPQWTKKEFDNENNHSVVVRVDFGQASFLFPGDLEEPAELDLVKKFRNTNLLDVDIYEAAHHGSHNGSVDELLQVVTPRIAVIPVGDPTREASWTAFKYGHPRSVTMDRLLNSVTDSRPPVQATVADGVETFHTINLTKAIYATSWDGSVVITAHATGTYHVDREK